MGTENLSDLALIAQRECCVCVRIMVSWLSILNYILIVIISGHIFLGKLLMHVRIMLYVCIFEPLPTCGSVACISWALQVWSTLSWPL